MSDGCQSMIGVYEEEYCGLETVPGTAYCLGHGSLVQQQQLDRLREMNARD